MHNHKDAHENKIQDLSSLVLTKIHEEKIQPTTKTYYTVRNVFLWVPGVFVTCVGAFAWAGIIFNTTHSSFKYKEFINSKTVPFVVRELPIVWLVLFLIFSLLVLKAFRQTKTGYRYNALSVLAISMGMSMFLGCVIYAGDIQHKNRLLRFPTEHIQRGIWFNPKEGRIIGTIDRRDNETVYLTDMNQKLWELDTTDVPFFETVLQDDAFVRIIGRKSDDDTFFVCMILPGVFDNDIPKPSPHIEDIHQKQSLECTIILKTIRDHRRERKHAPHP